MSILPGSWIQAPRTTHPPGTMASPASPLLASLWEYGPSLPYGKLRPKWGPSFPLALLPSGIRHHLGLEGARGPDPSLPHLPGPGLSPHLYSPQAASRLAPVSAQQTFPTRQENSGP